MRIHNVHERVLPVGLDEAAPLIDRLGQPDDLLFPTPRWPPMVLDGPLEVGARGGHGPMRYSVSEYEPGRRVEFRTDEGIGVDGTHAFSLEKLGDDRTILRHVIDARTQGTMRLAWPLAVRWIHDAMVEDLLDHAEVAVGQRPRPRRPWSPWVRLMRRILTPRAKRTTPPHSELLEYALPRNDFVDAHEIPCRKGMPADARRWADVLFGDFPRWVIAALAVRQVLVGLVGIRRQTKSEAFRTHASTQQEAVLGSDEKHLDFRVCVRREQDRVVVTTAVQVHNVRGRLYWFVVGPIHPVVIRSMLGRTARRLSELHR